MDNEKNSVKILSTNDIRKHALNWTLAGDVGLLGHLKEFSESICNKSQDTQKLLNELLDEYDEVCATTGNITNQFLGLQNCQFVENRVYDEETPTEEKEVVKEVDEAEKEKLLLMHYKEAVENGVKLLDTHFHEVQLPPNSDSDEEDDELSMGNTSLVWRPKNPYANKKFPLLIGSAEWWADDNVGLGDHEDNLDTEKMISESESDAESAQGVEKVQLSSSSSLENEKIIPKKPDFLKSSSEDIFGLSKDDVFDDTTADIFAKRTNNLIQESAEFLPSFREEITGDGDKVEDAFNDGSVPKDVDDSASQDESLAKKSNKKMDNAFTRELAAKLGSVTSRNGDGKTKKEIPPDETPKKKPVIDDFFDETDDADSDLFSGQAKNVQFGTKGLFFDAENDDQLFSGSKSLFFAPETNVIFDDDTTKKPPTRPVEKTTSDTTSNVKSTQKKEAILPKGNLVNDLFDNFDDDDTLFSSKPLAAKIDKSLPSIDTDSFKQTKSSIESKTGGNGKPKGLFDSIGDDFEDDLSDHSTLFGSNFNKDLQIPVADDSRPETVPSEETAKIFQREPSTPRKLQESFGDFGKKSAEITSIFESNNSTPKSKDSDKSLPATKESNERKINILAVDESEDDLFSNFSKEPENKPSTKVLYSMNDDDTSLFVDKPKQPDTISVSSSRSSIFDDVSVSKLRLASVFDKDKSNKIEDDLFSVADDSLFGGDTLGKTDSGDFFATKTVGKVKEKGKSSLFDDFDDEDDLFGAVKSKSVSEKSLFDTSSDLTEKNLFEKSKNVAQKNVLEKEKEVKKESILEKPKTLKEEPILEKGKDVKEESHLEKFKDLAEKNLFEEPKDVMKKTVLEKPKGITKSLFEKPTEESQKATLEKQKENLPEVESLFKQSVGNSKNVTTPDLFGEDPTNKTQSQSVFADESYDDLFTEIPPEEKTTKKDERFNKPEEASVPPSKKLWETKSDTFGDKISNKIFADDLDDAELFAGEKSSDAIIKPKPPTSLSLKKNILVSEGTSKSTGKLNIPEDLKARLEFVTKHASNESKPTEERKTEDLKEPFESASNLLKCPNKDRIKIQTRRRPQSRRARQEAIRNSGMNFAVSESEKPVADSSSKPTRTASCVTVTKEARKSSPEPLFSSPVLSNPLSPSTDEEDYFNVPELDKNFEKEDQSIFKSNLFYSSSSSKLDDNLLFDGAPVISPMSPKKRTSYAEDKEEKHAGTLFASDKTKTKVESLFDDDLEDDDDDDDDNLFKTPVESKSGRLDIESSISLDKKSSEKDSRSKKSLFDSETDDGDDLFGEKFSTPSSFTKVNENIPQSSDKKPQPKDKGNPSFVDPLGLISGE